MTNYPTLEAILTICSLIGLCGIFSYPLMFLIDEGMSRDNSIKAQKEREKARHTAFKIYASLFSIPLIIMTGLIIYDLINN